MEGIACLGAGESIDPTPCWPDSEVVLLPAAGMLACRQLKQHELLACHVLGIIARQVKGARREGLAVTHLPLLCASAQDSNVHQVLIGDL